MFPRFVLTSLVLTLTLAGAVRVLSADEGVPADRRMPAQTTFYMTIPDVEEFKSRFGKSLMGQMAEDEQLAEFRGELEKRFDEFSRQVEDEIGVGLSAILSVPTGEVSVGVFETSERKLGIVALLNFGKQRETVDSLLEKADEVLTEQGADRALEEIGGISFTVYEQTWGPFSQLAWGIADDTLLVGSGVAALNEVVARWDGEDDRTLSANENYQYILERCGASDGNSVHTWFLDPISLVKSVIALQGQNNFQAQMILGFLPQLGVDKLRAMGGVTEMATERFDTVSRVGGHGWGHRNGDRTF